MKINKELPTPRELKRLRQERDQSQDVAARSIGYTAWSWNKWEHGVEKAEIPLCAWLVYQLGGIDAVVNGSAMNPPKLNSLGKLERVQTALSKAIEEIKDENL